MIRFRNDRDDGINRQEFKTIFINIFKESKNEHNVKGYFKRIK